LLEGVLAEADASIARACDDPDLPLFYHPDTGGTERQMIRISAAHDQGQRVDVQARFGRTRAVPPLPPPGALA
jgi:hypothetical protein